MTTHSRRKLLTGAAALLAWPALATAKALPWPQARSIRWLIGLPPGGGGDAITRLVAAKLRDVMGQNIVVDNKPGAQQMLAIQTTVRSEADGYTVLSVAGPTISAPNAPGDAMDMAASLEPVAMLASGPMVLAGTTQRDTSDLASLVRAARAQPGDWSFGSAGAATAPHIAGELINRRTGMRALHVPYQGGGPAVRDAVAGHIPLVMVGPGPLLPHLASGVLRAYAVTTSQRFPLLPDVPTLKELGYGDIDLTQWSGVSVRAGTPANIVENLSRHIRQVLATDDVRRAMLAQGLQARPDVSATDWKRQLAADQITWQRYARELDIELS